MSLVMKQDTHALMVDVMIQYKDDETSIESDNKVTGESFQRFLFILTL